MHQNTKTLVSRSRSCRGGFQRLTVFSGRLMFSWRPAYTGGNEILVSPLSPQGLAHGRLTLHQCLYPGLQVRGEEGCDRCSHGGSMWFGICVCRWMCPGAASLDCGPPPTVLRALGSLIHCIMAFIIWEASFDLLTFVGAFNHLKRRSRESSSLEVFLAQ